MNYDEQREYGPGFVSLYQRVAMELHNARGRHICTNSMPPSCGLDVTDEIMKRVAWLIDKEGSCE